MRNDALVQDLVPIGMDGERADDIRHVHEAEKEEYAFEVSFALPRVTVRKTKIAAAATKAILNASRLGTCRYPPKIGADDATPANSVAVLPMSPKTKSRRHQKVTFTPKFSRMRSAKPLPVTAPIRAHISWTTTSAIVIGTSSHSIE